MDCVFHRATRLSQRGGVVVHSVPPCRGGSVPRRNPPLNSADSEIPSANWSIRNGHYGDRNGVFLVAVRQLARAQTVVLVLCNNRCPDRAGSLLFPRVFAVTRVQRRARCPGGSSVVHFVRFPGRLDRQCGSGWNGPSTEFIPARLRSSVNKALAAF